MSINFYLMDKGGLQRMCDNFLNNLKILKSLALITYKDLKILKLKNMCLMKKIKSLEDDLMNSKLPLDKPFISDLSINSVASVSYAMPTYRTMFIKPSMSHNHTQSTCGDKGASHKNFNTIPTCHHCGIRGHIRPNCFQIRSQNLGINCMYLGRVNQVLRTKSRF
jgi:hypothetical protein